MATNSGNASSSSFKRVPVAATRRSEFSESERPYKRPKPKAKPKYVSNADAFNNELLRRADTLQTQFSEVVATNSSEVQIINAKDALEKIDELEDAKVKFVEVLDNQKEGLPVQLIDYTRTRTRLEKAVLIAEQGFEYLKKVAEAQLQIKANKNKTAKPKLKRKPISKKGNRGSKK